MSVRTASRLHARVLSNNIASPRPPLRRPFFSLPGDDSAPATQRLAATRTLPYPLPALYDLIADVDAYASFVPYCSHSRVTRWAAPDADGRSWPSQADLHVGWGGFDEAFTSRLCCVPGVSVEAVSGGDGEQASAVFRSLLTRWSVKPLSRGPDGGPRTEVHLAINYQFANPLYAAVSAAVSDKVAGMMVEAFEKQATRRLGGSAAAEP